MADIPALSLVPGSRAGGRRSTRFRGIGDHAGPLDHAFILYLSSRADLLPAVSCVDLAGISDPSPPSPWPEVLRSLARELGRPPEEVYEYLNPEPLDAGPLAQWHAARLVGGDPVTFKLVRPEVQAALPFRSETLAPVVTALARAGVEREALDRARDDFRRFLESELDLTSESEALGRLSLSEAAPGRLKVPGTYPDCSGRFLLTRDRLVGVALEELVARGLPPGRGNDEEVERAAPRQTRRVRRLCRLWLGQALVDGLFPGDPGGRDVRFLDDGKISFGGRLVRMPPESQADLMEYLSSVASGDMERAADAMLRTLSGGSAEAEDSLRRRVRHAEPFRDPAWDFEGERFVKLVLLHWREARDLGFAPRAPVGDLFRGLFLLSRRIHRVDPDDQPVLQGFLKVRFATTLSELRKLADGGALAEIATRQAATLLTLPQKLDRALSLASKSREDEGRRRPSRQAAGARRDSWAVLLALLLALVAVVGVSHHLAAGEGLPGWIEKLGGGLVLILGALALFTSVRRP